VPAEIHSNGRVILQGDISFASLGCGPQGCCLFLKTRTANFCVSFFYRETEAHFTATGMPSQRNQSDSFRFKRGAFYQSLKSKVGLAAVKAAALRITSILRVLA
jgi:hypothetical protein